MSLICISLALEVLSTTSS